MKLRVAVVYGGRSGEHEVSVRSAQSIMAALDRDRYEVVPYFINKQGVWSPRAIPADAGREQAIDVVFPVLHGTFGEDGTVQGLLELAGVAYVGSGVLASAVAMDKDVAKRLCRDRGLPVVEYLAFRRGSARLEEVERRLGYPVFVKPANLGSSVGISKARNRDELEAALALAGEFDEKLIVERAVQGKELECAVLGNEEPQAALACEIIPSREFYDYEDKYLLDRTEFRLPAELTPQKMAEVQRMAIAAYQALECEGLARVDFFLETGTHRLYVNEVNTMPGFTSISMYPKMWEASGVSYGALLDRLIELALERKARRAQLRFGL